MDLIEDYVSNLNKLRDVFHNELMATADPNSLIAVPVLSEVLS